MKKQQDVKLTKDETKGLELSENELALIEQQRVKNKMEADCIKDVQSVLDKYSATLAVDPDSTLRNLSILVVFK